MLKNTIPNYTEQQIMYFQNKSIMAFNEYEIARELFEKHYLCFFESTFIAKRGEKINVAWSNGKETYIFKKISWDGLWINANHPLVHVSKILKSGRPSKTTFPLKSTKGYIRPDSQTISKATPGSSGSHDPLPPKNRTCEFPSIRLKPFKSQNKLTQLSHYLTVNSFYPA